MYTPTMKYSSLAPVLVSFYLLTIFAFSFAQLPLQVKPKVRGFPVKHDGSDGIGGRGVIEPMYRLNDTFVPSRYEIEVRVILDDDASVGRQFTAPGKVRIIGVNQERTSRIVLHAKDLEINQSSVAVTSTANPELRLDISGFNEDNLRDFFIIELGTEINANEEFEIRMEHVANIIQRDVGLFYKTYEAEDGERKRLGATQFQSVDARRMFPCFDEPDLKATFEMTIIRRENYTSLSNTEIISSSPDPNHPGWVIDKYSPTVKMSTYLVALIVSDYSYVETFFGAKPVRTYAPKHMIEMGAGNYSAEIAAKCLSFYETYFNETYKLAKMDSVAVPEFSGAMGKVHMEKLWIKYLWNCVFTVFVRGAKRNGPEPHNIDHCTRTGASMFGNLVTMKWWNHVFLNEGISTYAQYLGMEAASPDLMGVEYAILDAVQFSMLYDARPYTHPLSHNVSTPDEIEGMFSTVSYEKGASVLRMMEGFLTRETLQKGLQIYLKNMAYSGAEQDDLFDALDEVALTDNRLPDGLTVSTIMHSWTEQPGFPLVKVDVVNNTHISFSQERFKNHGMSDLEGLWYIPISTVTEDKPNLENNIPQVWLEDDGLNKTFPHDSSKWIMINNNATGFYRVLYDKQLAHVLKKQLESNANVVSPLSRSQLIDDYFVMAKQKHINIQAALNFTTYLHQETHFTVWSTFLEHFASIYEKFSSHSGIPVLKAYLQPKVDAALVRVGLEEDATHRGAIAILRADLLDWSCSLMSPLCREYALKLLAQWQADPITNPITSVDAKATMQCAIVASGGKVAFDFIFAKFKNETDSDTREELLSALACATDVAIVEELLNKTLSPEAGLSTDDAIITLTKVSSNPTGRTVILKFVSSNIDYIIEVIGNGHARPVAVVLGTLSNYFTTQSQLNQIQAFVDANMDKLTSISSTIKSVLGLIKENISWMNSVGFDIWTWLWFQ